MSAESATTARIVAEYLQRHRIDLSTEAAAQGQIMSLLIDRFGPVVEREVRLGPGERVDLMVGSVAIEVKVRASAARRLADQIERYAAYDRIGSFVVATAKSVALHRVIGGKRVELVNLSRGWM